MINFDALPTDIEGGNNIIPDGRYKATVSKAEMVQSKTSGKPYLTITWDVVDEKGKKLGKVFDNFFESDKEVPLYKLGCFVRAIDVVLTQFDLKDLTKVSVGKTCEIAVNTVKSEGYADKNGINVFDKPPYKKLTTAESFMNVPDGVAEELPFAEEPTAIAEESY